VRRLTWRGVIVATVTLLAAAQLARCDRTNPSVDPTLSVVMDPLAPARTAAVLRRACMDCHSNETRWPIYRRRP
jgi:hypothetical protein